MPFFSALTAANEILFTSIVMGAKAQFSETKTKLHLHGSIPLKVSVGERDSSGTCPSSATLSVDSEALPGSSLDASAEGLRP